MKWKALPFSGPNQYVHGCGFPLTRAFAGFSDASKSLIVFGGIFDSVTFTALHQDFFQVCKKHI